MTKIQLFAISKLSRIAMLLLLSVSFAQTASAETRTFTVNGVSFNMMTVDGGTFTMGSTEYSDEKPPHSVTLSSYLIGETEVTQELWKAVMGDNPSSIRDQGDKYPVQMVSWNDCQEFLTKLNALTGESFRLPTEAEWEYAARGGSKSKHYKFAGGNNINDVAWYYLSLQSTIHVTLEVAKKAPNELGLYDMSGNVWEWCQDWHGAYSADAQTNPKGPSSGLWRICRGGGGQIEEHWLRVSHRRANVQRHKEPVLGLRLAL